MYIICIYQRCSNEENTKYFSQVQAVWFLRRNCNWLQSRSGQANYGALVRGHVLGAK